MALVRPFFCVWECVCVLEGLETSWSYTTLSRVKNIRLSFLYCDVDIVPTRDRLAFYLI